MRMANVRTHDDADDNHEDVVDTDDYVACHSDE